MNNLDLQCINAIRVLSADAIQKSNSGHPGLPLGAASMAYTLWTKRATMEKILIGKTEIDCIICRTWFNCLNTHYYIYSVME